MSEQIPTTMAILKFVGTMIGLALAVAMSIVILWHNDRHSPRVLSMKVHRMADRRFTIRYKYDWNYRYSEIFQNEQELTEFIKRTIEQTDWEHKY